MAPPPNIVDRAQGRVAARRERFVADGVWGTEPIDLVRNAALRWPDRVAVSDRRRQLTYQELDTWVGRSARSMSQAGVGPGDSVLVVVQNDVASVVGIHGVLRCGAIALVAPTTAGKTQLADIHEQASPALALAPESAIEGDLLPDLDSGWRVLESFAGVRTEGREPLIQRGDEPSMVVYTSGTTSRPKGVIHSMSTLLAASRNYIECADLDIEDRLFVVSPLASITGLLQCITVPPMLGAQVVLETKWEPEATFDLLLERGGTFFGGPDLLLDRLLDVGERRGMHETTIGAVYLGGAMLDPRILDRVENEFGIVVMRAYGSSEAPISTAGERSESREVRLADDGAPLGGVQVRRGSSNDPAECCITGPHLFLGYVDEEDDEHAFEIDGDGIDWFCTGDVADLTDGRVKIVGRIRDIVIRKGLKVPISEVEGYLNGLPGVERSAGYSTPDPETGERLAVAVIPEPDATLDFDELVAGLTDAGLATWKLPEEVVVWDEEFPENATGKVLRPLLDERSAGRPRLVAPRLREGDS